MILDATVSVRPRHEADLPLLVSLLEEQQPESTYPEPWPLPGPTHQFIAREHELVSWVALRAGSLVGHIAIQSVAGAHGVAASAARDEPGSSAHGAIAGQARTVGHPGTVDELADAWCRGHRRPVTELASVTALFVTPTVYRSGIGAMLLDTAVTWMTTYRYAPCLEVLPQHRQAIALYHRTGWHTVAHVRSRWLPASHPPALAMILPG